jgi:hypothetical protein
MALKLLISDCCIMVYSFVGVREDVYNVWGGGKGDRGKKGISPIIDKMGRLW